MNINISRVKMIVTIPLENVEEVRNAICEAGSGVIGNYTHCSMSTKCVGTFKPTDEANPYIGEKNNLELVDEEKLEVVCDVRKVKEVVSAIDVFPNMTICRHIDTNYYNPLTNFVTPFATQKINTEKKFECRNNTNNRWIVI